MAWVRPRTQWGQQRQSVAPGRPAEFLRSRGCHTPSRHLHAHDAQNVQDEDTVRDVNAEVDEGVNEALHLQAVVIHVEIALNEVLEGGIDVEGVSLPVADEAILQG
jgi:hypothetical protein